MSEYNARAKRAIGQMMGRQVLLQCLTFAGGVVVARMLGPAPFGLYIMSSTVVGIFAMLGDFGLAPSFIQRKAELTPRDMQVGFTLQQLLTTAMVAILWVAAPLLSRWLYPDQPAVVWLVRALSFNLYLTSWRTMSAIALEREVKFGRLAGVEVLEVLVYQAMAVGLTLAGLGTWSYVIAAMSQGLLGTVLVYAAAPWPVRLRWDWAVARDLIRFGVPFQLQMVMNSAGGWVTPLVVGRVVGSSGVGLLYWAQSNGKKPMMVTDNIMRVGFPHMARLQGDPAEVERLVVRYLTFSVLAAGLWFAGVYCVTPVAVQWVYHDKWLPGVTALRLYAAVLPLDMLSMVAGMSLNGIGRVRFTTVAVGTRTVANVALTVLFVWLWRPTDRKFNGVPVAFLAASLLTIPWLLAALRPGAMRRVLLSQVWMAVPLGLGLAAGLLTSAGAGRLPLSAQVLLSGSAACLGFAVGTAAAAPAWLRAMAMRKLRPPPAATAVVEPAGVA
jgi:O-antigen/teichoic acid export membrane protein